MLEINYENVLTAPMVWWLECPPRTREAQVKILVRSIVNFKLANSVNFVTGREKKSVRFTPQQDYFALSGLCDYTP